MTAQPSANISPADYERRRFIVEAGQLAFMLDAGGYALYVTESVKPDKPVPGVSDPALFWHYSQGPIYPRSYLVVTVDTIWARAQRIIPSLEALEALDPKSNIHTSFAYADLSDETREVIWPGWPVWPIQKRQEDAEEGGE